MSAQIINLAEYRKAKEAEKEARKSEESENEQSSRIEVPDDPEPSQCISCRRRAGYCCKRQAAAHPASAQAEDARQAGAEPLNGNGFYRFRIGDFQATVISDGYGRFRSGRPSVWNASEAELAPVLKANFMQPVIQARNNILVVDTGPERILCRYRLW